MGNKLAFFPLVDYVDDSLHHKDISAPPKFLIEQENERFNFALDTSIKQGDQIRRLHDRDPIFNFVFFGNIFDEDPRDCVNFPLVPRGDSRTFFIYSFFTLKSKCPL